MRRSLGMATVGLAFAVVPVSPAFASPISTLSGSTTASLSSITAVPSRSSVSPMCCAGVWYGWGYYPTKAACVAAGKEVVHDIPVALLYKCRYGEDSHRTEWKLYIFEAG